MTDPRMEGRRPRRRGNRGGRRVNRKRAALAEIGAGPQIETVRASTGGIRAGFDLLSDTTIRDLGSEDQDRLIQESWWLYKNSPTYKHSVNRIVGFIVGDGAEFVARDGDEAVQAVIDGFVGSRRRPGTLSNRLPQMARGKMLFGEQLYTAFVGSGARVRIGYRDPLDIFENETDNEDSQELVKTWMKDELGMKGQGYDLIRPDPWLDDAWISNLPPASVQATGGAESSLVGAFYLSHTRELNATRGFPHFSAGHNWFHLEDNFIYAAASTAKTRLNVTRHYKISGDPAEFDRVKQMLEEDGPPGPDEPEVTNENVAIEYKHVNIGAGDLVPIHGLLGMKVAHTVNLPIHWLLKGDEMTFASAKEIGHGALRVLQSWQAEFFDDIRMMLNYQLWVAKERGILTEANSLDFDIIPTSVLPENEDAKLDRLTKASTIIQMARLNGWHREGVLAQTWQAVAKEEGLPLPDEEYDPDEDPARQGLTPDAAQGVEDGAPPAADASLMEQYRAIQARVAAVQKEASALDAKKGAE